MAIQGFAHINVSTTDLERSRKFYAEVLGLKDGYRPQFQTNGAWMYLDDQAIVHITTSRSPSNLKGKIDAFDHFALWSSDINYYRNLLKMHNIKFVEFGVPETFQYQLFFKDPDGTEIELIFSGEEALLATQSKDARMDGSFGRDN
jgi:catechol 2,3-dioxygenase-like lactoylglutathione lyase family enzyme